MNRLAKEKSAYLQHSAHQNIDWYPWSDEAFEKARREDKPVFLSSGAIWCHWCHVMAKECFFHEEIVSFLNENFVSVKLDRDERPDIDRRYQRAVAAMGVSGGWPLNVFLTPDRRPFFGGAYFPPEDRGGRPGFGKVLRALVDFYRSNRDSLFRYAGELMRSIESGPRNRGELREPLAEEAEKRIEALFDPRNGGFGTAPKFPMPGALEFMLNRYFFSRNEAAGYLVRKTLGAMAKGGVHDQLGGGFHRYSVDEAWIIPHFEKMADDNAWLLRIYAAAYRLFGDEYFRTVADGIIEFAGTVLTDAGGGFYASQNADVTPDDEGGFFTWTEDDFRRVLNDEEYRVLSLHLLHEKGAMHHDARKRVLFVALEAGEIAAGTGMDPGKVEAVIAAGKKKLLQERSTREVPLIDRTFYASLNGMFITSYLKAFRAFGDDGIRDFALKSLARIMERNFKDGELFHSEGVKALLDDYLYLAEAFFEAYEVTGDVFYLTKAEGFMEACLERFRDNGDGGFFDTDAKVIDVRLKGIEDIPHPSANSLAILLLLKLYYATDRQVYLRHAEAALETFAADAADLGIHSGYYFCAADAYFRMAKLNIEAAPGSSLAREAVSLFRPYTVLSYGEDKNRIVPCIRDVCHEPVASPDKLKAFVEMSRG